MGPLSYVVSKARPYFIAATNISIVGIGQIAAQKGQRETMAGELVAGALQFVFIPFNAERSEQVCTGIAGELFQVTAQGRGALILCKYR
jgi:hypothetical protein